MAGMHRDKCGAAVVAGLFAILSKLQPKGLKVVGKLALVRNSIGADSYVADEVYTYVCICVRGRLRTCSSFFLSFFFFFLSFFLPFFFSFACIYIYIYVCVCVHM